MICRIPNQGNQDNPFNQDERKSRIGFLEGCDELPRFAGFPIRVIRLILSIKVEFVVVEALELQAHRAEVDQQADFHIIRFEVVDGLGEVDVFQLDDGFEFDHDEFFDEEVHAAGADFLSTIEDGHFLFAFEGQALIGHFDYHRALIDHFLKAVAQRRVDFHRGGDDAACQVFVFHGHFQHPIMVIP